MPEISAPPQASWEELPEQSAAALRQALMHSLELENPNFDSPAALRAGVKEAIAKNKLLEVHQLLGEQISDENREELEALQALLKQEAILHDFEGKTEKQMTPEEEHKVIDFLSRHRIAIAVIGAGLLIGWQGAALIALINAPNVVKEVEGYFNSASEAVQGWWNGMKDWWSGDGGTETQAVAETQAGQVADQIVQETETPYEEQLAPNTSTPQNSTEFNPEPSPSPSDIPSDGVDPFETTETEIM